MVSVASLAFESQLRFSDRVAQLLDRIDCRAACSEEEREAIFRLRYPAYLHEGAIGPNFSGTFCESWRLPSITPFEASTTKSSISENVSLFKGLRPIENTNHFSPLRLCER